MINSLLSRNKKRTQIDKIRDVDGNIATAHQVIADKFNNYFTNIAETLKSKIPQNMGDACQFMRGNSTNYGYNKHFISNSIYLTPTNSTEISQIIDDLKVKATADINVASIKTAKNSTSKFSETIADIINSSLIEGVFPDLC